MRACLLIVAGLAASACGVLAWHHPLSAPVAWGGSALLALGVAAWPGLWLLGLPAWVPVIGLAPWTGWITFEEADLIVLAVAAGGYGRWALEPSRRGRDARQMPAGLGWAWLLVLLWTADVALATARGVADAGGWAWAWYEGYRGPMNALRLAKPTLALWLLLPLWLHAANARSKGAPGTAHQRAVDRLTWGLALGHGLTALVCLAERLAYTGLLNFSTDYRSTGPFWEMHVGGAALDGFLALTFPFALRLWWRGRGRWARVLGGAITLLGAYACVTTFSRIVYLAVPMGAALMLLLHQRGSRPGEGVGVRTLGAGACLVLATVASAAWVFPLAGYRGMLAVLGCAAMLLQLAPRWPALRKRDALAACMAAVLLALLPWSALTLLGGKWPYLAFALLAALAGGLGRLAMSASAAARPLWLAVATGAYLALLGAMVGVARNWGGESATWPAAQVALCWALGSLGLAASRRAWWPDSLNWQAGVLGAVAMVALVVAVLGNSYMSSRFETTRGDEQGRMLHWKQALWRLPDDSARWLGQGQGRFLEHFVLQPPPKSRPGDLRLVAPAGPDSADAPPVMRMVTGNHQMGWGELLRLSQRIERPMGLTTVRVTLRNADQLVLHADVCIKHLLYDDGCQTGQLQVPAQAGQAPGVWRTMTIPLVDKPLAADPWWALRWTVFSLSTEGNRLPVDVREISLHDADGRELLSNRRFEQGGARWFFSSDRNHMPWHAKNLAVHLLFEQGYLGLAAMGLLAGLAWWRVALGRARQHPLAPALAAALLGFGVVGTVDSLLDVPRLAMLFWLLCGVALSLKPARRTLPSG